MGMGWQIAASAIALTVWTLAWTAVILPLASADQVLGTWTLASWETTSKDAGQRPALWNDPKGRLTFDAGGRFSYVIIGERPGTETATLSSFGTYTLKEGNRTVSLHIERSSQPNSNADAKQTLTLPTGDELRLSIPAGPLGAPATFVWKRVR